MQHRASLDTNIFYLDTNIFLLGVHNKTQIATTWSAGREGTTGPTHGTGHSAPLAGRRTHPLMFGDVFPQVMSPGLLRTEQ